MNHCQLMLHSLRDIRRMRDIVERSQDERERRAELVGDIGEEAQTLLVEFLLLLVVHLLCPELVLARGGIQLFHTRPIGRNPEFAILRLRHTGNIVGGNAGSILGIMLVALPFFSLIVEGIETIVLGSYPYHGSLGIIYHAVQFAARDALSVSPLIIIKEAVAIKTP